jgi:hypothetical protein
MALACDGHPLVLPTLSHCRSLAEEFRDLSPAFQKWALRFWLSFRHPGDVIVFSMFRSDR